MFDRIKRFTGKHAMTIAVTVAVTAAALTGVIENHAIYPDAATTSGSSGSSSRNTVTRKGGNFEITELGHSISLAVTPHYYGGNSKDANPVTLLKGNSGAKNARKYAYNDVLKNAKDKSKLTSYPAIDIFDSGKLTREELNNIYDSSNYIRCEDAKGDTYYKLDNTGIRQMNQVYNSSHSEGLEAGSLIYFNKEMANTIRRLSPRGLYMLTGTDLSANMKKKLTPHRMYNSDDKGGYGIPATAGSSEKQRKANAEDIDSKIFSRYKKGIMTNEINKLLNETRKKKDNKYRNTFDDRDGKERSVSSYPYVFGYLAENEDRLLAYAAGKGSDTRRKLSEYLLSTAANVYESGSNVYVCPETLSDYIAVATYNDITDEKSAAYADIHKITENAPSLKVATWVDSNGKNRVDFKSEKAKKNAPVISENRILKDYFLSADRPMKSDNSQNDYDSFPATWKHPLVMQLKTNTDMYIPCTYNGKSGYAVMNARRSLVARYITSAYSKSYLDVLLCGYSAAVSTSGSAKSGVADAWKNAIHDYIRNCKSVDSDEQSFNFITLDVCNTISDTADVNGTLTASVGTWANAAFYLDSAGFEENSESKNKRSLSQGFIGLSGTNKADDNSGHLMYGANDHFRSKNQLEKENFYKRIKEASQNNNGGKIKTVNDIHKYWWSKRYANELINIKKVTSNDSDGNIYSQYDNVVTLIKANMPGGIDTKGGSFSYGTYSIAGTNVFDGEEEEAKVTLPAPGYELRIYSEKAHMKSGRQKKNSGSAYYKNNNVGTNEALIDSSKNMTYYYGSASKDHVKIPEGPTSAEAKANLDGRLIHNWLEKSSTTIGQASKDDKNKKSGSYAVGYSYKLKEDHKTQDGAPKGAFITEGIESDTKGQRASQLEIRDNIKFKIDIPKPQKKKLTALLKTYSPKIKISYETASMSATKDKGGRFTNETYTDNRKIKSKDKYQSWKEPSHMKAAKLTSKAKKEINKSARNDLDYQNQDYGSSVLLGLDGKNWKKAKQYSQYYGEKQWNSADGYMNIVWQHSFNAAQNGGAFDKSGLKMKASGFVDDKGRSADPTKIRKRLGQSWNEAKKVFNEHKSSMKDVQRYSDGSLKSFSFDATNTVAYYVGVRAHVTMTISKKQIKDHEKETGENITPGNGWKEDGDYYVYNTDTNKVFSVYTYKQTVTYKAGSLCNEHIPKPRYPVHTGETDTQESAMAHAYSEFKEGSVYNETFEAMAGVPSTRTMYFATGGEEFIVNLQAIYDDYVALKDRNDAQNSADRNQYRTVRKYTVHFNGIDCEYKAGDTFKALPAGGQSSETFAADANDRKDGSTAVRQKNNAIRPTGATSGNTDAHTDEHSADYTVTWEGDITNNTGDPGFNMAYEAGKPGVPCQGDGYTEGNGHLQKLNDPSTNWDVSRYNTALRNATDWARQMEQIGRSHDGTTWRWDDSDGAVRYYHCGTAVVKITLSNGAPTGGSAPIGGNMSPNFGSRNGNHGSDCFGSMKLNSNDETILGAGYSYNQGTAATGGKSGCCEHGGKPHKEWDEPPRPASGTPGEPGYSPAFPGIKHAYNHQDWFNVGTESTSAKSNNIHYVITVSWKDGTITAEFKDGNASNGEVSIVPQTRLTKIKDHAMCGACCMHHLRDIEDTWTQKLRYDTIKFSAVKVWKISDGYANGMSKLKTMTSGTGGGIEPALTEEQQQKSDEFDNRTSQGSSASLEDPDADMKEAEAADPDEVPDEAAVSLADDDSDDDGPSDSDDFDSMDESDDYMSDDEAMEESSGSGSSGSASGGTGVAHDNDPGNWEDGYKEGTVAPVSGKEAEYVRSKIVRCDPNIFYNIAQADTSKAGRIRYSLQTGQDDDVYYEEMGGDRSKGFTRDALCDGQTGTGGTAITPNIGVTPVVVKGSGHKKDFCRGCLYTNSTYSNVVDRHRNPVKTEVSAKDRSEKGTDAYGYKSNRKYEDWDLSDPSHVELKNMSDVKLKTVYTDDTADRYDMETTEWKRFDFRRHQKNTATVISDFLILQTTSGDQGIMYYEDGGKGDAHTLTADAQENFSDDLWYSKPRMVHNAEDCPGDEKDGQPVNDEDGAKTIRSWLNVADINSANDAWNRMWVNNPHRLDPQVTDIFIGGYNGKYSSVNEKYKGTGKDARIKTAFDEDGRYFTGAATDDGGKGAKVTSGKDNSPSRRIETASQQSNDAEQCLIKADRTGRPDPTGNVCSPGAGNVFNGKSYDTDVTYGSSSAGQGSERMSRNTASVYSAPTTKSSWGDVQWADRLPAPSSARFDGNPGTGLVLLQDGIAMNPTLKNGRYETGQSYAYYMPILSYHNPNADNTCNASSYESCEGGSDSGNSVYQYAESKFADGSINHLMVKDYTFPLKDDTNRVIGRKGVTIRSRYADTVEYGNSLSRSGVDESDNRVLDKVNNIVIHDPVSVQDAYVISADPKYDQRVYGQDRSNAATETAGAMTETCPGNAADCVFRVLNCRYADSVRKAAFSIDNSEYIKDDPDDPESGGSEVIISDILSDGGNYTSVSLADSGFTVKRDDGTVPAFPESGSDEGSHPARHLNGSRGASLEFNWGSLGVDSSRTSERYQAGGDFTFVSSGEQALFTTEASQVTRLDDGRIKITASDGTEYTSDETVTDGKHTILYRFGADSVLVSDWALTLKGKTYTIKANTGVMVDGNDLTFRKTASAPEDEESVLPYVDNMGDGFRIGNKEYGSKDASYSLDNIRIDRLPGTTSHTASCFGINGEEHAQTIQNYYNGISSKSYRLEKMEDVNKSSSGSYQADKDIGTFTATADGQTTITVTHSTGHWYDCYIYDSAGSEVAHNSNLHGQTSTSFTINVKEDETYRVHIKECSSGDTNRSYSITGKGIGEGKKVAVIDWTGEYDDDEMTQTGENNIHDPGKQFSKKELSEGDDRYYHTIDCLKGESQGLKIAIREAADGNTTSLKKMLGDKIWKDLVTKYPDIADDSESGSGISGGSTGAASKVKKGDVLTYGYTGNVQKVTLPKGEYKLEVWGAQGGKSSHGDRGGNGGYAAGTIKLNKKTTLYIVNGGAGGSVNGGYNGGGNGGPANNDSAGGGGATHIATADGQLSMLVNNKSSVLIVAGGGGASGCSSTVGGAGGGTTGGYATDSNSSYGGPGMPGTQTSGGSAGQNSNSGSFGKGGDSGLSQAWPGGGGGAGWYGGGAGGNMSGGGCAGAGGSGYLSSQLTDSSMQTGVRMGNGAAQITVIKATADESEIEKDVKEFLTKDNINDIPDTVTTGDRTIVNPIWTCDSKYDRHVCTPECRTVKKGNLDLTVNCTEPHHEGKHYDVGDEMCYDACNDDSKHRKAAHPSEKARKDENMPSSKFILLDNYFKVHYPTTGNFHETDDHGILRCERTKGMGYVNNMDCAEWTREKWIRFPYSVLYKRQSTQQWEEHQAGEWFQVDIGYRDNSGYHGYTDYEFYCQLINDEAKSAHVDFFVEAINEGGPEGSPYGCEMFYGPYGRNGETNHSDATDITALSATNADRGIPDELRADHSVYKYDIIDVVGRIGNLLFEDVEDLRFSNFFKKAVDDGTDLMEGVVHKVDSAVQNMYFSWHLNNGDTAEDIRGIEVSPYNEWYNTYGTEKWTDVGYDSKRSVATPIQASRNNIPSLRQKEEQIRFGYNLLWDISTIGNYYAGGLQIEPKYYLLDTQEKKVIPVDVYMAEDDVTKPVNYFGLMDEYGTDRYKELTKNLYDYSMNLDWKHESAERNCATTDDSLMHKKNYGTALDTTEWQHSLEARQMVAYPVLNDDGSEILDADGENKTTPLEIPHGEYYRLGNIQFQFLTDRARTFFGNSVVTALHTDINGADDQELWSRYSPIGIQEEAYDPSIGNYYLKGQRWHTKLGIPSTARFTDATDVNGDGLADHIDPDSLIEDEDGHTIHAYEKFDFTQDNIAKRYVVLETANITAIGDVWNLHYDQGANNGLVEVHNETYDLPQTKDFPTLLAVYGMKTPEKDFEYIQTH